MKQIHTQQQQQQNWSIKPIRNRSSGETECEYWKTADVLWTEANNWLSNNHHHLDTGYFCEKIILCERTTERAGECAIGHQHNAHTHWNHVHSARKISQKNKWTAFEQSGGKKITQKRKMMMSGGVYWVHFVHCIHALSIRRHNCCLGHLALPLGNLPISVYLPHFESKHRKMMDICYISSVCVHVHMDWNGPIKLNVTVSKC